jgi:hypothetical protein
MANIAVRNREEGTHIYYFESDSEVKTVFYDKEAESVVYVKDKVDKNFEVMKDNERYSIVEEEDIPDKVLDFLPL